MKFTIFLVSLFCFSCSKKDDTGKKCYRFEFSGSINPGLGCERPLPYLDTCVDPWVDISKLKFVDKCNNDLGWTATEK